MNVVIVKVVEGWQKIKKDLSDDFHFFWEVESKIILCGTVGGTVGDLQGMLKFWNIILKKWEKTDQGNSKNFK